jgi:dihydroflavonol-4-reductase
VGAHVTRALAERGEVPRVIYRNPKRLRALAGVDFRQAKADVLDFRALRRAMRGSEVLFHIAGYVGSSPSERVWRLNAHAPVVAVEAAAAEGLRRVVITSTISAIGVANGEGPADEQTEYPADWLGLAYPDSKHQGERAALEAGERHGIEVVVVNPAYVLGVPVNRDQPGETSTRTIGNYLLGRLPAVVGAPMNYVDVEDAAAGHLLAADHGRPGERYILGGENATWPALIDRIAKLSGVTFPVLVLPPAVARVARMREAAGLRGMLPAEASDLMGRDWRFSSGKAERELGYGARPLEQTLQATIGWYQELMANGAFGRLRGSSLSRMAGGVQAVSRLGMLTPLRLGQRVTGWRMLVGV